MSVRRPRSRTIDAFFPSFSTLKLSELTPCVPLVNRFFLPRPGYAIKGDALQQPGQHPSEDVGGGEAQLAGWAVLSSSPKGSVYNAQGAAASTPDRKPAWSATGLATDGLSAEDRELQEALEASRLAVAAAAAAASDEERQLAAAKEASRLAEETRQREEADAKMAIDVSTAPTLFFWCYRDAMFACIGIFFYLSIVV